MANTKIKVEIDLDKLLDDLPKLKDYILELERVQEDLIEVIEASGVDVEEIVHLDSLYKAEKEFYSSVGREDWYDKV